MIKKHMIALYINTGTTETPIWTRVKKSTKLTINMDAKTEDYDYIADESPTTELDKYQPKIEKNPLTMYEGEPDFEAIFNYFYDMKVGDDAKVDVLVVFMFSPETGGAYKAWKNRSVITIEEMDAVASELSFNLLFGGTMEKGTATIASGVPTFTPAE